MRGRGAVQTLPPQLVARVQGCSSGGTSAVGAAAAPWLRRRCKAPCTGDVNRLGRRVAAAAGGRERAGRTAAAATAHASVSGSAVQAAVAAVTTVAGGHVHTHGMQASPPLLHTLQSMSLQQAALHSSVLLLATAAGVLALTKGLDYLESKMCAVLEGTKTSGGLRLVLLTAVAAGHRPIAALIPLLGLTYSLVVAGAFADVLVSHVDHSIHRIFHICAYEVLEGLRLLVHLLADTKKMLFIVLVAWFLVEWKNRMVAAALRILLDHGNEEQAGLARILVPLSNALSWAIVGVAVLMSLNAYGIDTQILLTFGSISTVAVGFAVQRTAQNLVAALGFYTTRPFIVGDKIQLLGGSGSVVVEGAVCGIGPLHTTLITQDGSPLYVSNTQVVGYMVKNLTQGQQPARQG